ncbi:transglutaminase family protein [Thermodesulfobacteriota bacterium]
MKHTIAAILIFLLLLTFFSCTATKSPSAPVNDFARFADKPLTPDLEVWLKNENQSQLSASISEVAATINGTNRRERLYKAVDYIWTYFNYDNHLSIRAFARTADELFVTRKLGGCSDFALAKVTLFRAVGIPARLVVTANVEWMLGYQQNDLMMSTGHVFIEAYLEDRWYLVDSTYRFLYNGYDLAHKSYPRKEYFVCRGRDFWDMGVANVADVNTTMRRTAVAYRKDLYIDPEYPKLKL